MDIVRFPSRRPSYRFQRCWGAWFDKSSRLGWDSWGSIGFQSSRQQRNRLFLLLSFSLPNHALYRTAKGNVYPSLILDPSRQLISSSSIPSALWSHLDLIRPLLEPGTRQIDDAVQCKSPGFCQADEVEQNFIDCPEAQLKERLKEVVIIL